MKPNRREFLKQLGLSVAGAGLAASLPWDSEAADDKLFFEISLAQFSFASEFFSGKHDLLGFPARAKSDFGINIVEYVSMFFAGKEKDPAFLKELRQRTDDLGVRNNLIMVDGENIADLDKARRTQAVESHYHWVDAANVLGCQSIRVNLGSMDQEGSAEEVAGRIEISLLCLPLPGSGTTHSHASSGGGIGGQAATST